MKKGISLIVMLITIVVIIILAASIINTVIYNNPMDNAKEATFRSDLQEMKYAYGIRQGELMAKYKGDKTKIKDGDYAGVVHKNYEGEILAFDVGLAYLGEDKQKQEIAESMDYIIGNPNDSVLYGGSLYLNEKDYKAKITKIKFITSNKVPKEAIDSWNVSGKIKGSVMAWIMDDGNDGYELTIGGNGKVIAHSRSDDMFSGFSAVKEIDIKALDTSNVTTMASMFAECRSLTNINVSNFDTSSVEDMSNMFYVCPKLTSLNLSSFDTSNVTTMSQMFYACGSLMSLDLSNFNTSQVIYMTNMFGDCRNMTSLNLGNNFDTSSVTYTNLLFDRCKKIKTSITIRNAEITNYENMFQNAAIESGAEIRVNYTSATSSLVDKMLETKSSNSNVKKGEQVSI